MKQSYFLINLGEVLVGSMKCRIALLFFCCIQSLFSQKLIEGRVSDSKTKVPLAFVNILINNSNNGISTDIDGEFRLETNVKIDSLTFSYVGYELKTYTISELQAIDFEVSLKQTIYQLDEVEILPGVNPAHRIIDSAIANKDENNPELATPFTYQSYNKLIFSVMPDSVKASEIENTPFEELDTNTQEAVQFMDSMHLFLMESVTERNHIPPTHSKEVVKASRVSGFRTPTFSLIGTQLQSFSLYKTYIQLFSYSYLSPISKGSTSKYLFILEDTIFQNNDTVYSISFQPRRGKNFDGLKGVLTINTDNYAVQNFVAETIDQEEINVKIQQSYAKIEDLQWFPAQLNTLLLFNLFEQDVDLEDYLIYGEGKSYIDSIQLQSKLTKKTMGNVVLSMDNRAAKKDSSFWNTYRRQPLTEKEKTTYHVIDSIGEEIKLDKVMSVMTSLIKGAVPIGPIDIRLNRLFDLNGFEGFRLGIGAETNDKLIRNFSLGAYGAYGFGDEQWKYGTYLKWAKEKGSSLSARIAYEQDVVESGGTRFYNNRLNPLSSESLQKLFLIDMDNVERYEMSIEATPLRDFQTTFFINHQKRHINSDYRFNQFESNSLNNLTPNFQLTEAGINIRFSYREKFIEMFGVKTPISFMYPIVHLKLTRGFDEEFEGNYNYNRIDLKIQKAFRLRNLGYTLLRLEGGYIDRTMPITNLFRARGIQDDDLLLAADLAFQTAQPNEFFHDQYFSFFFKHSFKSLLFKTKNFKPELAIVSNVGWGEMRNKNRHENIIFNTMSKGFFESGIQIDRLLDFIERGLDKIGYKNSGVGSFGVGAYYRYGALRFEDAEDNIFLKVTYSIKI